MVTGLDTVSVIAAVRHHRDVESNSPTFLLVANPHGNLYVFDMSRDENQPIKTLSIPENVTCILVMHHGSLHHPLVIIGTGNDCIHAFHIILPQTVTSPSLPLSPTAISSTANANAEERKMDVCDIRLSLVEKWSVGGKV